MEVSKLLQRLYISKVAKSRLADTELTVKPVEWEEVVELLVELLEAFGTLKTAVGDGRLQGEPGKDGTTPVAGRDYLSRGESERMIRTLVAEVAGKVRHGKDAEVTEEHIRQAAEIAHALIELPDFDALITENPAAVRDALELLSGDERLSIEAIAGLKEELAEAKKRGSGSFGATIARRLGQIGDVSTEDATVGQVLTRKADGTYHFETPAAGSGVAVETPPEAVNGSRTVFTVSAEPKWIVVDGSTYFAGYGYSYAGLEVTVETPPSLFIRAII